MSTLTGNKISLTYKSLLKTADNDVLTAALKEMSDGLGNSSGVYLNTGGDFKSTGILEFANFKGTSTAVTINKLVNEADGISNNDNDTSLPTSAAVKDYVNTHVTTQDLDFVGDNGAPGAVDLDSQSLNVLGTTNEIVTSSTGFTLTIGLPDDVTISGTYTGATFAGDLLGTINTATTATNQIAGTSNQTVATTKFVMDLDSASDLDFSGDTGTGDVNLNTESLAITGTTNQIVTAANLTGLSLAFPTDGIVLPDGSTATTQTAGNSSTKVATTQYVDTLDAASDLDLTGDSGTGDVNLNTQSLNILGTPNQVTTAVIGQTATIGFPTSISVNLVGTVTGDLTGNADTATAWQTAQDLSLTSEATGTISNVDGTSAVSGAVTLLNSAVTGKVLTGLPSPAAATVLPTDSILEGIGKLQSQINGIANGLQYQGTWEASTNTPTLTSGGGEVDSGTTDGATTAFKLIDSTQNFSTTVSVTDKVINQVDGSTALVTNIDSNTSLTLDADIMLTGEAYTIDASPFLVQGHYYVVSVGGTTSLNGNNNWAVGDWVIAGADNVWAKLDHTQVDGQGSPGNLSVWATATTLGDSIVAESGTALTITGSATTTLGLSSTGDFAVNTDKFTANATTGAVAFEGGLAINTDKFTVNATSGDTAAAGTVTATSYIQTDNNLLIKGDIKFRNVADTSWNGGQIGADSNDALRFAVQNAGSSNVQALLIDTSLNATFAGTISGVLADGVTATTQAALNGSTKVATTAYADAAATAVPIGDYLPLIGGTLTGALTVNGEIYGRTSAAFPGLGGLGFYSLVPYLENANQGGLKIQVQAGASLVDSLTLDSSKNATFAGNVGVGNSGTFDNPNSYSKVIEIAAASPVGLILNDTRDTNPMSIANEGAVMNLRYNTTSMLALDGATGNSTFAGNVKVNLVSSVAGAIAAFDSNGNTIWLTGRSSDGESSVSFRNNADSAYNGRIAATDTLMSFSQASDYNFAPTGGVITLGANGHITSKQSLDVATAGGRYVGSSNRGLLGQIKIEQTADSTDGGYITFDTCASGSTTPTEKMRIDSSGSIYSSNSIEGTYFGQDAGNPGNVTGASNSSFGFQAGAALTTGNNNIFLGKNAGVSVADGSRNNLMGSHAGYQLTSGSYNVALGDQAMFQQTTASGSVAVGRNALYSNIAGGNNTAIGDQALTSCTGSNNTAVGLYSGLLITSGGGNVSMGVQSLQTNQTGESNTALGMYALYAYTGSKNTAIGYEAGKSINTDIENVFVGYNAGKLRTGGVDNTFVGSNAGYSGGTGCCNTGVGRAAGYSLTSGVQNTFFGRQAGYSVTTANNNTLIGHNTGLNITGADNTCLGSSAGGAVTSGYNNTFVGSNAGDALLSGYQNICIGKNVDTATNVDNYSLVIGTDSDLGRGSSTGFIGANSGSIFQDNNSASWATTSDERIKKNIVDNNKGLEVINKIQIRNFEYRTEDEITDFENPKAAAIKKKGIQLGVIAQEIEKILPKSVKQESTGVKSVNPDNLTWYLINAVKELKAEVDLLKSNKCNCK